MDDLSLLGVLMVIFGVVMAPFTPLFLSLIFALVGILMILSGRQYAQPRYAQYPMYKTCAICGRMVEAGQNICPHCQGPM